MVRKISHIVLALLLLSYFAFAVAFMNPKANIDKECTTMQIEVVENGETSYLSNAQVESFLKKANVNPVGKKMSAISTEFIEKVLKENKLIKEVESFKTVDGTVKIKVYQRIPVLRIISEKGNYYVDKEGQIMPVPLNFAAYVPIATGNISEGYAKDRLYPFALFLRSHKFWNEQIEQIYVAPNLDIELTPRKGNHLIVLGKIEDYEENLDKLKLFYGKGLDKVGWNKYSVINLKYKNQVVCTKRE
jgi:cell division protein FtsQ